METSLLDFLLDIITTFIGAAFAFGFTFWLYRYKKHKDDEVYLKYAIACFVHMHGVLYTLKEQQIFHRKEEVSKVYDADFEPKYISKKILYESSGIGVDIERLNFLAEHDTNVIMLLRSVNENVDTTIKSISICNETLNNLMIDKSAQNVKLLLDINQKLVTMVDNSIYLTGKASEVLIKGYKNIYGGEDIGKFELTDAKYERLKPEPIESFEKQEYFQKSKCFH